MSRKLAHRAEDGYVIVVVMLLLAIVLAAGAAALAESLGARDSATRTARSERALQAADAGIQTELYRANQVNLGSLNLDSGASLSTIISQLLTCPVPQVNGSGQLAGLSFGAIASVGSPCPPYGSSGTSSPANQKEPVGDHAYYDVRFIPGTTNVGDFVEFNPKIVALGIDDGGTGSSTTVTRRVEAILSPIIPWRTVEAVHNVTLNIPGSLSALGVLSAGSMTLNGTEAAGNALTINGTGGVLSASTFNAASISLSGGLTAPSALDYCTRTLNNVTLSLTAGNTSTVCSGLVSRPAVALSPSKQDCAPVSTGAVPCSTLFSSSIYPNSSSVPDSIYCASSCPALTFQPGDYVFCDFQYNGTVTFNASATQAVRIFIDNPGSSRCSTHGSHPTSSNPGFQTTFGNFVATHGVGNVLGTANPSRAQVYVVGNGTNDGTTAYSTGDSTLSSQDMFLYAPTSNVTVTGGQSCVLGTCVNAGTLAGAFIGYDVTASGTAITQDLGLLNYPLSSTLGPFHIQQYLECAPVSALSSSNPASGC